VRVLPEVIEHPLLGRANWIEHEGVTITAVSVIDWDDPQEIPVIAEPGRLPPEGARLLNDLARAARRPLRYAGPYPTPGLYRALLRSFRASAGEDVFTRDVVTRALALARDPIDVEFTPAPHERIEIAGGHVEVRSGVEAAMIAGTRFEQGGAVARIVDGRCEVWFGDACYAHVATLAPSGELIAGPNAPPALASRVLGQAFPVELRVALAELVAEAVPAPLAQDARAVVAERAITWADLGTRAARRADPGFEVHAALWERIAPLGLARLALALAEALAPVVTSTLVAELSARAR
jgi:hypothetical protein